jgi:hypothetical protein
MTSSLDTLLRHAADFEPHPRPGLPDRVLARVEAAARRRTMIAFAGLSFASAGLFIVLNRMLDVLFAGQTPDVLTLAWENPSLFLLRDGMWAVLEALPLLSAAMGIGFVVLAMMMLRRAINTTPLLSHPHAA